MFDAILFIQLGSPADASPSNVEKYLADFLGDRHTLGDPPFFWNWLLRRHIAPRRALKSAAKYREMIRRSGLGEMPLVAYTRRFAEKMAKCVPSGVQVRHAFEFGSSPTIAESLSDLRNHGARRLRIVPLFPQRSLVTTIAVRDLARDALREFPELDAECIDGFALEECWTDWLATSILKIWNGEDAVLLSFHAVPQKWIDAGDPYRKDCDAEFETVRRTLTASVPGADVRMAFQSRLGPVRWTGPSTSSVLEELGRGHRGVLVACPSFTADNLETLYEVDVEMRKKFSDAGGVRFARVPCPNDDRDWIDSLASSVCLKNFGRIP